MKRSETNVLSKGIWSLAGNLRRLWWKSSSSSYIVNSICYIIICIQYIWRSPRKSGLTPETTEIRIVCYAIIQVFQSFVGLTHSYLQVYIYHTSLQRLWVSFIFILVLFICKLRGNSSIDVLITIKLRVN